MRSYGNELFYAAVCITSNITIELKLIGMLSLNMKLVNSAAVIVTKLEALLRDKGTNFRKFYCHRKDRVESFRQT
jgi:hypothetical protein